MGNLTAGVQWLAQRHTVGLGVGSDLRNPRLALYHFMLGYLPTSLYNSSVWVKENEEG